MPYQPLADILRPISIDQIIGQKHLLGKNGILTRIITSQNLPSIILWGRAGCGKTSIAKILSKLPNYYSEILSATNSSVADLRKIFNDAIIRRKEKSLNTILIIDEIHRFNKSQQDLFLPHIENGTIILIGATTENPSFELNSALLSRSRIIELKPLFEDELELIIKRAEQYKDQELPLTKNARQKLIEIAANDTRYLLNLCEELFLLGSTAQIDIAELSQILHKKMAIYDKSNDNHYGLISALHKTMRGSDVDASLYYLARMLEAGEDPNYILRRIIRFASEDVGMADPNALVQAIAAKDSYHFLGKEEGDYAIANAVIYCATAPKSNSCYKAYKNARIDAKKYNNQSPPKHILNAPTKMMKKMGYKEGYIYDHDTEDCFSGQEYFPEEVLQKEGVRPKYYNPNERGFERDISKRIKYWKKLRNNIQY
ncbi:replication-associated recombination protein A [Rickettsiales bacterium]|nr:replication-associated recombination protein A [Rickettsiales bacterium]